MPWGLPMLPAWPGLAELGLPGSECRSKIPDPESSQIHITSEDNTNSKRTVYIAIDTFYTQLKN
jgi:hypothetical protein